VFRAVLLVTHHGRNATWQQSAEYKSRRLTVLRMPKGKTQFSDFAFVKSDWQTATGDSPTTHSFTTYVDAVGGDYLALSPAACGGTAGGNAPTLSQATMDIRWAQ
jgi:hypothetical protein